MLYLGRGSNQISIFPRGLCKFLMAVPPEVLFTSPLNLNLKVRKSVFKGNELERIKT